MLFLFAFVVAGTQAAYFYPNSTTNDSSTLYVPKSATAGSTPAILYSSYPTNDSTSSTGHSANSSSSILSPTTVHSLDSSLNGSASSAGYSPNSTISHSASSAFHFPNSTRNGSTSSTKRSNSTHPSFTFPPIPLVSQLMFVDNPYGNLTCASMMINGCLYQASAKGNPECSTSFKSSLSSWASSVASVAANTTAPVTQRAVTTSAFTPNPIQKFTPIGDGNLTTDVFTWSATKPCCGTCSIYGGTVQVFLWAGATAAPNISRPATAVDSAGFTFTSPSIYVAFQSLYAADFCGDVGTRVPITTLAFDPSELSTTAAYQWDVSRFKLYPPLFYGPHGPQFTAASWNNELRCGQETYSFFQFYDYEGRYSNIDAAWSAWNNGSFTTDKGPVKRQQDVGRLTDPWQLVSYSFGTSYTVTYNLCSPTLSVPKAILTLNQGWGNCVPGISGFYDPPYTLTPGRGFTSAGPAPGPSPAPSPGVTPAPPIATQTPDPSPKQPPTPANTPGPAGATANPSPPANPPPSNNPEAPSGPSNQPPANNNPINNLPAPVALPSPSSGPPPNNPPVNNNPPSANNPSGKNPPASNSPSVNNNPSPLGPPLDNSPAPNPQANNNQPPSNNPQTNNNPLNNPNPPNNPTIPSDPTNPAPPAQIVPPNLPAIIPAPIQASQDGTTHAANPASPTFLVGSSSRTLVPGFPAITVAGTPISLLPGGQSVVIGGSGGSTLPISAFVPSSTNGPKGPNIQLQPVGNAASPTYIVKSNSQTLVPGAAGINVDGTSISLQAGGSSVVVGGSTLPVGALTTPPANLPGIQNIGSPSQPTYIVGSQTLLPGAPGLTISGTPISLQPGGLSIIIGTSTLPISALTTTPPPLPAIQNIGTPSQPTYIIGAGAGSQTLLPGAPALTILGTTLSLQPDGSSVVIGGSETLPISALTPLPTGVASVIINGQTTPLSAVLADITGAASLVISGKTEALSVTVGPDGVPSVVVDGKTEVLSAFAAEVTGAASVVVGGKSAPVGEWMGEITSGVGVVVDGRTTFLNGGLGGAIATMGGIETSSGIAGSNGQNGGTGKGGSVAFEGSAGRQSEEGGSRLVGMIVALNIIGQVLYLLVP